MRIIFMNTIIIHHTWNDYQNENEWWKPIIHFQQQKLKVISISISIANGLEVEQLIINLITASVKYNNEIEL